MDHEACARLSDEKSAAGNSVRAARGMLDWTQEQLAALAGVSRSTVCDFEGCRRELHQTTEALLIKAFERPESASSSTGGNQG